jgi:hypothetical protein
MSADEVNVCQTDYLSASDIAGQNITVTIVAVDNLSFEDRKRDEQEGKKKGKRPSKDVILTFAKARKQMRCNPTNQWSIAVLLGTKKAREWVGKRIVLRTDSDTDLETGGMCACIRIATSPDASEAAAAVYDRAWSNGARQRGKLCARLKREHNLMMVASATDPTATTSATVDCRQPGDDE